MSQQTPIAKKEKEDGSDVCIKICQYLVEKKLQELKDKSVGIKIDDATLPQPVTQLPPLTPSTGGEVPWETVLKNFRAKWYNEQKKYAASDKAEGNWDSKGHPIIRKGYKVAIIGAGVAGLRTAMLLQSKHIPYKIFEASGRPGGRLFTYKFPSRPPYNPPGHHDYYDVGGMRFPNNNANKETFDLFRELNLANQVIDYVFSNDDNIRYYNSEL
jgi:Flavin containing amine oxidoreductase